MPDPRPRRSWPAGLLLVMASTLVALAGVELLLRWLHPLPDPYQAIKTAASVPWPGTPYVPSAYPPHHRLTVQAEPGLPGIDTLPRVVTMNNLGFRGDSLAIPKPAGELRVFVVGGSTTECIFLDDREALGARLQAYLRLALPGRDLRVYAAGKSGDKSFDHVAMAAHRIAHLQPDVIVVFAGVNDLMAGVGRRDYLLRLEGQPTRFRALLGELATEFQLPRLVHAALHGFDPADTHIRSNYRQAVRAARAEPLLPLPSADPAPFARNLLTLQGIARAQGARVVLMTQATTWNTPDPVSRRWHWMSRPVRYPEPALESLMERYNDATRAVGAAQGLPVFDLDRRLPHTSRYLYDDVHFNVRGADTTALLLARFMVEQGVVPPAPDRVPASAPSPAPPASSPSR
jgi:lysophospholipase L1-like esterase